MNNTLLKRLHEASSDGDTNKLEQLLKEDPLLLDRLDHDVLVTEARDNPLHVAALHGHVEFIRELLILKPQLADELNREGRLPLHLAAARGHLEVVEMLVNQVDELGQRVYVCSERKYGYTPVHTAAINGKHDVVKMLVQRCKEALHKTTNRKETLLHLAVTANCLDSVHYLINQGVNINAKDIEGNTCFHLACQRRNQQVITYLLNQVGLDVNSTNARGLTALDVLLVSSWGSPTDIFLVNALRKAGGGEAQEQGKHESNLSNSRKTFSSRNKDRNQNQSDAKTLLVVATLVATMTFPAISSPPGGFIQLPYNSGDDNNAAFYNTWFTTNPFPAGRPVLLWQLKAFYALDSMALFSSISVILFLLCGIPKRTIVMKFLVVVLWLSAFCTALAFASAFLVIYFPDDDIRKKIQDSWHIKSETEAQDYDRKIRWVYRLLIAWSIVYIFAALWASVQVIKFLWRKGGLKKTLPSWVDKFAWPENHCFKKTTSITFMICFLAIIGLATWGLWVAYKSY